MKIIHDDLWLCVDCLFVAVNGDASGLGGEGLYLRLFARKEEAV